MKDKGERKVDLNVERGRNLSRGEINELLARISKQYNTTINEVFFNNFTYSVLGQYMERGTLTDKQIRGLRNMHIGIKDYEARGREMRRNSDRRSDYGEWDDHPYNDLGSMGYLY